MAELQIILDAIQDMRDSHHECMESVRNEMQTGLRSSAIQIKAEMDVVNLKLKIINYEKTVIFLYDCFVQQLCMHTFPDPSPVYLCWREL